MSTNEAEVQQLQQQLSNEKEEEAAAPPPPQLRAVLTPPLSLDGGLWAAEHRPPNFFQRILSTLQTLRPGADLTHFKLPPFFNVPKSHLQVYGETVYSVAEDYLGTCAKGKSSLERFRSVVAWSMTTLRPPIFGQAPFNPTLGETHHVSNGTLNVLLEQVSHQPPVTALHATDAEANIDLTWCHNVDPKFHGTSVEIIVKGKRHLKLLSFGETYEMDAPSLLVKILPPRSADWHGNVRIQCKETDLAADLHYYVKSQSYLSFGGSSRRAVKGKISSLSKPQEAIYEISGDWDKSVALKDVQSGEVTVLYEAKQAISTLRTPVLKDPKNLWPTESAVVWSEVSEGILSRDWAKATRGKGYIEEHQRKLEKERKAEGKVWSPKHFSLTRTHDGGWECAPLQQSVPPAPIVIPQ